MYNNLKNDIVLLKKYDSIFAEQKEARTIETVESTSTLGDCYYIAHHPVFREDKKTYGLRIVFDASVKENGPSLNEVLYKESQITPLVFDILILFRTYAIALTSDIKKDFHEASVHKKDSEFFKSLWFDNDFFFFLDQPKILRKRFARVIFGVTFSPFLLNEAIKKHVKNQEFDIDFVNKIFNCFDVDDFKCGQSNFYKTLDIFKKLKLIFLDRHSHLREWRTNDLKLRKVISENTSNS